MTAVLALQLGCYCHTESCRDAVGGMSAGKGVVLTLKRRREGTNASQLAIGAELLAATRQNLMSVGLVTYVPHDAVFWGVVDVV